MVQARAKALTALTIHNAPPVVYPLGRSRFQGCLLLGLWLAGLVLVLLWFCVTRQLDWRMAVALVAVLGAGVATHSSWKNAATGQLAWDGEVWCWESPSYQTGIAEQQLSVIVDCQHLLLLRLENQAHASLWLWAEQKALPERWLDLRRAVFSSRKASKASQPHDVMHAEPLSAVAVSGDMSLVDAPHIKP